MTAPVDGGGVPPVRTSGAQDAPAGRTPARAERGWTKLLLALAAFLFLPMSPHVRAMLPIENSLQLLVPAIAACAVVGWWAGGRAWQAFLWVALAAWMTLQPSTPAGSYESLLRGWSLLLAGSFGLVCLFSIRQPFFSRAMATLGIALGLALVMSLIGPVSLAQASRTVSQELTRRNTESLATFRQVSAQLPGFWKAVADSSTTGAALQDELARELKMISSGSVAAFPALLSLESLIALALAWALYHRLSRARLGAPLGLLREFRFNDQLVWGLIVGLTIVFLPTLASLRGVGRNLLVFFGALYAVRGLGILTWFVAPAGLAAVLAIAFAMLSWPVLRYVAFFTITMIVVAAFGLGIGDTWADWRSRARSTT